MKVCIRCKIPKRNSAFGKQISRYKNKVYISLKGNCKACLNELQKQSYKKIKDTPEFKKRNAAKSRQYRIDNPEKHRAQRKLQRRSGKYKATRKKYIASHKQRIHEQEAIAKTRYYKKNRDHVSDRYVANILRSQGHGRPDDIIKDKELIEYKRGQILLFRLKRKISHAKNLKRAPV